MCFCQHREAEIVLRVPDGAAPSHIGYGHFRFKSVITRYSNPDSMSLFFIGLCADPLNMAFYQTNLGILVVVNALLFYRQRRSSRPAQSSNVDQEDAEEEPKDFVEEVDTRVADFVKQYLGGHLLAFAADWLQVSKFNHGQTLASTTPIAHFGSDSGRVIQGPTLVRCLQVRQEA